MNNQPTTTLITGINGFVGAHLTRELTNNGHNVIGTDRREQVNPEIADLLSGYVPCDMTDPSDLDQLPLGEVDAVIHLAGLSAVGASFDEPQKYMTVNTAVLTELFEAITRAGSKRPRIISVSTGAVYAPNENEITEDSAIQATSPYAASKLASEIVINYYRTRGFVDSVNVRPFNHVGPGQGPGFLVPDIAFQIKDTPVNGVIKVGNITTSRDYTDVRDVVRAYRMLAETKTLSHETYNICSTNPSTGEKVLEILKAAMNRPDITIEVDPDRIRPTDVMWVSGSHQKLTDDTGWQPKINLERTLTDFANSLSD